MATFLAATDTGSLSTSPMSAAKPAGVTTGDKMFALVFDPSNSAATLGAPSGWVQIGTTHGSSGTGATAIFYKDDDGTAGPYSFTFVGGSSASVTIVGYRGLVTGAVDANQYDTQLSLSVSAQSSTGVTPTQAGDTLLYMAGTPGTFTWTPNAGYTSRITGSNGYAMDQIGAPSGATGTITATTSAGSKALIWMVAIKASTGHMMQRMVL